MRTRTLKFILVAAAVVRLGLLAGAWNAPQRLETPDSDDYIELSDRLARDATFARDGRPEVFRTPGYPFFLTVGAALGAGWWRVIVAVQIALDVLLVYLTFMLGTMLCSRRVGLIAAAFQAVAVVSIASSLRILSDGLFVCMLTLTILLLVHHFKTGRWWSLLSAAAMGGLACYVRPVGLSFCVLAAAVLLFRPRRFRRAGAFAAIVLMLIVPWVVRNAITADFIGFSSFASDSMFYYSAPAVVSEVEGISFDQAREKLERELQELSKDLDGRCVRESESILRAERRRITLRTLRAHPLTYARIHAVSGTAVWLPGITDVLEVLGVTTGQRGTLTVLHERGLPAAVKHYLDGKLWALWLCAPAIGLLGGKYVLAALCAAGRVRLRMGAAGWLILLTVAMFAFSGGPAATPRFRVPIEPLVSLAAGAGVVMVMDWRRRRRSRHDA